MKIHMVFLRVMRAWVQHAPKITSVFIESGFGSAPNSVLQFGLAWESRRSSSLVVTLTWWALTTHSLSHSMSAWPCLDCIPGRSPYSESTMATASYLWPCLQGSAHVCKNAESNQWGRLGSMPLNLHRKRTHAKWLMCQIALCGSFLFFLLLFEQHALRLEGEVQRRRRILGNIAENLSKSLQCPETSLPFRFCALFSLTDAREKFFPTPAGKNQQCAN